MFEILGKTNIDFMGKRAISFAFSGSWCFWASLRWCKSRGEPRNGNRFCRRHGGSIKFEQADPDR